MNRSIVKAVYVAATFAGVGLGAIAVPQLGYSMGTPPFDADLRTDFSPATKQSLEAKKCLDLSESVEVVATYQTIRPRQPIVGTDVSVALDFPARDRKGARLIPVFVNGPTDATGTFTVSIPLAQALEEAKRLVRKDRGYRGVRRVKGPLMITFTTADTLQRSVRYVPARGLKFRLCRTPESTPRAR
jgi:hypothetical protein